MRETIRPALSDMTNSMIDEELRCFRESFGVIESMTREKQRPIVIEIESFHPSCGLELAVPALEPSSRSLGLWIETVLVSSGQHLPNGANVNNCVCEFDMMQDLQPDDDTYRD